MAEALHIETLVSRARELGADRAAPLDAAAVVIDERVRLKCRVPLCSSYGVNLMCPPNVPTPAETRAVLACYADAVVVQSDIPLTQGAVDEALAGMGYAESQVVSRIESGAAATVSGAQTATIAAALADSQNGFARLMTALEAAAFKSGYRFAAAFAGGECVLCDVCVGPHGEACRHPFAARPSMEAVGIDVIATAAAAGLAIEMPATDKACWTGLLLVG